MSHIAQGRALGITQDMVDAITDPDASPLFTDEEKAAIALSLALTRDAHADEELFARVRRHFDDRQIVELVVNIGIANLNNRFTEAFWADLPAE